MFLRTIRVASRRVLGGAAGAVLVANAMHGGVAHADSTSERPRRLKSIIDDLNSTQRDSSVVMSAVFPRTASLAKDEPEFAATFDGTEAGFHKAASDAKNSIEVRALGVHLTASDILDTLTRNFKELRLDVCDMVVIQQAGSQIIRITNGSRTPTDKSRSLFLEVNDVRFRAFYAADHLKSHSVDLVIGTIDERVVPYIAAAVGAAIAILVKKRI